MPYSLPSDTRYILYEETDLAQLKQKPCHFKCGIYLICTHGQALISTGGQQNMIFLNILIICDL